MDVAALPLVAALSLALALPLLVWSVAPGDTTRARALRNLERGHETGARDSGAASSTSTGTLARIGRRLTPSGLLEKLDRSHARAGRPASWPLDRILATKVVLLAVGLVVSLLVATSAGQLGLRTLAVVVLVPPFAWFLPDILLYNTGIKRREQIQRALPDMLDQLSIAVEAGLGFEGALSHVARNTSGPLSEEVIRTLQDMRVGMPRRDAYGDLATRVDVVDLRRFVRAIVQAEASGVSVAAVLNVQAGQMRLKRSQRAEEDAMKIPVKVIFPLMFCIMPALLVVILGPAVLRIMETFSQR